jgi:hypothetical protein
MENNQESYIKTNDNIIINEKYIRWVKKIGDCLYICTKSNGCNLEKFNDTHEICKFSEHNSYNKLNQLFK